MTTAQWLYFAVTFLFLLAIPSLVAHAKNPLQDKSWGLRQVEAERAWKINPGSKSIVVAVVDTGIDIDHPSLKENIWTNPGESGLDDKGRRKESNGIDDDHNGYVDDVHGWNFVDNSNDVSDHHGHGTHVAGIIGGVSFHVSLMALKYFDPERSEGDNLINTIQAIRYATKMNANVINYSGGGFSPSFSEQQAIRDAGLKSIVLVAAAGNERVNSDVFGFYPADYGLPNIVSVTAVDRQRKFLNSSNFGRQSVHIAAPGKDIYSTLPRRRYGLMTGTSQATAFVSGAIALLMSDRKEIRDPQTLIQTVLLTGNYDASLVGKTQFESALNVSRMLTMRGVEAAANNQTQALLAAGRNLEFSSQTALEDLLPRPTLQVIQRAPTAESAQAALWTPDSGVR